jgi:RNA ligase-like protein
MRTELPFSKNRPMTTIPILRFKKLSRWRIKSTMKKYGRTYHLPMSPGVMSDDKILRDLSALSCATEVVFTEKMDGENTTIHQSGCHARSPDSGYHASRDWMKAFSAGISPSLSENERIVGEYLFARHSVAYENLRSYFIGFAWIVDGTFQAWDTTLDRFETLGIQPVSVLHRGPFNDTAVNAVLTDLDLSKQEGFVVRTTSDFHEADMSTHVAKYVRADHVQSETHWMHAEIVRNGLLRG